MAESELKLVVRALALGAVSGLRSMSAPAALRYVVGKQRQDWSGSGAAGVIVPDKAAMLLGAGALGEIIMDKLPKTPDRTNLPSVLFRAASGAAVGYGIFAHRGRRGAAGIPGALLGAAASVAATYGAFHARKALCKTFDLPDTVVALGEDALALSVGMAAARIAE